MDIRLFAWTLVIVLAINYFPVESSNIQYHQVKLKHQRRVKRCEYCGGSMASGNPYGGSIGYGADSGNFIGDAAYASSHRTQVQGGSYRLQTGGFDSSNRDTNYYESGYVHHNGNAVNAGPSGDSYGGGYRGQLGAHGNVVQSYGPNGGYGGKTGGYSGGQQGEYGGYNGAQQGGYGSRKAPGYSNGQAWGYNHGQAGYGGPQSYYGGQGGYGGTQGYGGGSYGGPRGGYVGNPQGYNGGQDGFTGDPQGYNGGQGSYDGAPGFSDGNSPHGPGGYGPAPVARVVPAPVAIRTSNGVQPYRNFPLPFVPSQTGANTAGASSIYMIFY